MIGGNIALSPNFATDHILFVGGFGVYKSSDAGATWTGSPIAPYKLHLIALSPHFATDKAVFAAVSDSGVFRSFGGTSPWTPFTAGLQTFTFDELRFSADQQLIMNVSESGLWTYTDGGLRLPSAPIPAFASTASRYYFPQTAHSLAYGFKSFWDHNGALAIFGYPQTEEFTEVNPDNGKVYTVQYFERQRYEYHPELKGTPYETELGRLGATDAQQRDLLTTAPFQKVPDAHDPNCLFFPQTSHTVCGSFKSYWLSHGLEFGDPGVSYREALALFGYPLSEVFTQDGGMVQYFERAVFEYHPQNTAPYTVLLRRLGADILAQRGW